MNDQLDQEFSRKLLLVIIGPTAVGKTRLAIRLAKALNAEIISADSRLLYRGMDIGTAKPTPDELTQVPHHLIDVADPDETWSLAMYQAAAQKTIADIHQRGGLPVLVGGTGQYVRAVVQGWTPPEVEPNLELRRVLEEWGASISPSGLHARLRSVDPDAALNIEPNNLRRTVRALEVILSTGHKYSLQRKRVAARYNILQIGLTRPRSQLYERIDQRIEQMFANGFVEEVASLVARGYNPELPTMSALGYQEVCAYLKDEISLEQAYVSMRRRTRSFVRRQANWFKPDDAEIHWFDNSSVSYLEIESQVKNWLSGFFT